MYSVMKSTCSSMFNEGIFARNMPAPVCSCHAELVIIRSNRFEYVNACSKRFVKPGNNRKNNEKTQKKAFQMWCRAVTFCNVCVSHLWIEMKRELRRRTWDDTSDVIEDEISQNEISVSTSKTALPLSPADQIWQSLREKAVNGRRHREHFILFEAEISNAFFSDTLIFSFSYLLIFLSLSSSYLHWRYERKLSHKL